MREGGKLSTCLRPPHGYLFQTAHYKSECPQVLKGGKDHAYKKGQVTIPGNYNRMIAVSGTLYKLYGCQFATVHGPRLVYQTQQDP